MVLVRRSAFILLWILIPQGWKLEWLALLLLVYILAHGNLRPFRHRANNDLQMVMLCSAFATALLVSQNEHLDVISAQLVARSPPSAINIESASVATDVLITILVFFPLTWPLLVYVWKRYNTAAASPTASPSASASATTAYLATKSIVEEEEEAGEGAGKTQLEGQPARPSPLSVNE